jgi:hypothetical protein
MRATLGFVGLLAVLGTGYYFYTLQLPVAGGKPPLGQIDSVRVRNELLGLAQAERLYLAMNGSYGTLEQLSQSGNVSVVPGETSHGYSYEVEIDGSQHFRIVARPSPSAGTDLPTLSIDERMQVMQ